MTLKFSLAGTSADGAPLQLGFWVDRCAGAFNGVEVGVDGSDSEPRRFLSGDDPLWPNPLADLSPHLAVQYDYYVEAKRVLLEALAAAPLAAAAAAPVPLPAGAPTLRVAREVLVLAEALNGRLQARVPFDHEA